MQAVNVLACIVLLKRASHTCEKVYLGNPKKAAAYLMPELRCMEKRSIYGSCSEYLEQNHSYSSCFCRHTYWFTKKPADIYLTVKFHWFFCLKLGFVPASLCFSSLIRSAGAGIQKA